MQVGLIVEEKELDGSRPGPASTLRVLEAENALVETPRIAPPAGYSGVHERSTPLHAVLEYSMFFLFPCLLAAVLYHSTVRLYELEMLWSVALAVPLSFILGDFVTGMVHWAADTYGSTNTPIIGKSLIKPFRLHHQYPKDICTHSLVATLGNSCIVGVPLLALCLFFLMGEDVSGWLAFAGLATAVLALVTAATNQFHKWAHQDEPARLVRWLQNMRLVLGPGNHQTHHTEPFDNYYCITNGWLNPLLRKLKFFRGLETGLRWIGIKPTGRPDVRC